MKIVKAALITSLSVFALASGSALAADMGMPLKAAPPPPPAPVYNWTGCFVGGGGGYGMNNIDTSTTVSHESSFAPLTQYTTGGRGWLGQVSAGCDYQFSTGSWGNWVIGAFADYEFMDLTSNHDQLAAGEVGNLKENGAWAVGGRIGYLITPNFLTYWDGGYTQTHFDQVNYLDAFPPYENDGLALPGATYHGWFLGSGFEYSFNWLIPGLFLKTEYRFSSYGAKTLNDGATTFGEDTSPFTYTETLHPYVQTVTTQLVYRFNWLGH